VSTISINAKVACTDGPAGHCETVIVNPVTQEVTHLVIADKHLPNPTPRLVPLARVVESREDLIRLNCTKVELADMEQFIETQFVSAPAAVEASAMYGMDWAAYGGTAVPPYSGLGSYYVSPYVEAAGGASVPVEAERVPPGELAVHRGMTVRTTDGSTGHVHAFLVDAQTGHISHVMVDVGHLLGKKEIAVPLAAIDHVDEETVYLRLDKHALDGLPAIAVKPHWFAHAS
jgi:hypothetical protein